jgi:nucleotide-binding universal stress UspA family protein
MDAAMSYAAVMVYIDAYDRPEQRVRLVAGLADKFHAPVIGLSALAMRPPPGSDWRPFSTVDVNTEKLSVALAETASWFHRIASADHRKLEWRPLIEFPLEALAGEARSADLVVIGRSRAPGDVYSSLDPGGAILRAGRPTLVVPDEVSSLRADHAVIGWKDTREARRAVQDALPLLHEATRVSIVEICRSGEQATARQHLDDVAKYLIRHRISGGPRIILQQEGSGAAQLIRLAQDEGADLLVTGAYGHSRMGEWAFGGMTRDLLSTSPICCLMSH